MSDTPRTDARLFEVRIDDTGNLFEDLSNFARKLELEGADLRRDLAAANTVIARMREALIAARPDTIERSPYDGGEMPGYATGLIDRAMDLTPATVRDEVAELQTDNLALRGTVDGLQWTLEAWSAQAGELAKEFPGVDWMGVHAFIPHVRALRTRAEKAEADVARLCNEAQILVNIIQVNTDPMGRCTLDFDMTVGTRAAIDAARQPTPQPHEEGKR